MANAEQKPEFGSLPHLSPHLSQDPSTVRSFSRVSSLHVRAIRLLLVPHTDFHTSRRLERACACYSYGGDNTGYLMSGRQMTAASLDHYDAVHYHHPGNSARYCPGR